jgi:type IV secretory pathway VirB3-like protein
MRGGIEIKRNTRRENPPRASFKQGASLAVFLLAALVVHLLLRALVLRLLLLLLLLIFTAVLHKDTPFPALCHYRSQKQEHYTEKLFRENNR